MCVCVCVCSRHETGRQPDNIVNDWPSMTSSIKQSGGRINVRLKHPNVEEGNKKVEEEEEEEEEEGVKRQLRYLIIDYLGWFSHLKGLAVLH